MTIDRLLARMPQREMMPSLASGYPEGVALPDLDPSRRFIEPALRPYDGVAREFSVPPRVILVAASAAVGKTTLATNLARKTGNPYWDLSKFKMGSGFFSGILSSAYGVERYAQVIEEIRTGKLCLILDAVDEAIVASTSTNFAASLQNLVEVIGETQSGHAAVIFLGRPETITDTYLYLSDLGVEAEVLEVSYFSEDDAKRFISAQVIESEGSVLDELQMFIDAFFGRVKDAFGSEDWSVIGSFLGYAPVLDSLSLFYRESENAYRELNDFVSDGSKTWSLIGNMLARVLQRETEKFAHSFGGANEKKRSFAASAYTLETQISWLLADDAVTMSADPDLSLAEEPEWLSDIEQSLRDQFQVHPFLRSQRGEHARNVLLGFTSAAFRDYVVAEFLRFENSDNYIDVLRAYWLQPEVVPSMMLSRFIRSGCDATTTLDARVFAFILDSHSKQNGGNAELMYVELAEDAEGGNQQSEDRLALTFGEESADSRDILVDIASSTLELGRSAAYSILAVPTLKVVVGAQLPECDLGPRVAIECDAFSAQSSELHINHLPAANDGSRMGASIRAKKLEGVVRKVTGSREVFSIDAPVAPYPWQPFKRPEVRDDEPTEGDLLLVAMALRRIAVWFRRGGRRFAKGKMDTILSKGRASQNLFTYLMSRNLIWSDEPFYRMSGEVSIGSIWNLDFGDAEYKALVLDAYAEVDF